MLALHFRVSGHRSSISVRVPSTAVLVPCHSPVSLGMRLMPLSCVAAREPRWGRNIETPGEDPYLTSQYAIWYTKGMQESPDDAEHIQASACCKHFVGNSMEFTTQKDGESENRASVDSNISMRDLVDSYMVPFQACVEVGKVSGLMCSYNSVNGVPSW